jgi:hypothetical protein
VWANPEKTNVFNVPFSKKKKGQHVSRKDEGWVSIRQNQPPRFEESEGEEEGVKTPTGEDIVFPELDGGVREIVLEETVTASTPQQKEKMTALAWAERIKKSLEKAEADRAQKAKRVDPEEFKEALGRLSFFRRPVVASEK